MDQHDPILPAQRKGSPDEASAPSGVPDPTQPSLNGSGGAIQAFQPGEVVGRRYRVVRLIARGAHGEVYEAEDLELRGRVALKTVRPEIAFDPGMLERFRREIHLARKVTHPNVCRIFDIGYHELEPAGAVSEQGSSWNVVSDRLLFLTMELLQGETLSDRLRRTGPLSTAEALPLVRQLAAGLAAAHAAGIVHRDFKSANVMLVTSSGSGSQGLRAVITDFGLARVGAVRADQTASLTASGQLVGTPAYMAPEQVEGGPVGPATDLYSLGVVLYETITGQRPFRGETTMSIILQRLKEKPASPRVLVPELDPLWESVILRCLERAPADRFQSATELSRALQGEAAAAKPAQPRPVRWAGATAALVCAALLGLGLGLYLLRPDAGPSFEAGSASGRRTAAVLGFKNLSGRPDAAWLSTALSEMLAMELTAGERLRIIPGENVARMKVELGVSDADSLAADTLRSIRSSLGADLVLLGSYLTLGTSSGGRIRLDLRVQDSRSGQTVGALTETGTEAELLDLISRTGTRLREKLELHELSAAETGGLRRAQPANPEAARLYAEGLTRLRLFDALAARELLQKAVEADPKFPLAHSALATAWAALGYDAEARQAARQALDLASGLAREERLHVEGLYREMAGERDAAVEIYRTLWDFYPDNLEYGLRLAAAQIAAGRARESLDSVERLRKLPAPASLDPRIALTESLAAGALSDFRRQEAAAERAVQQGLARGARHLVARALLEKGAALWSTGQAEQALRGYAEAKRIFEESGDRWGMARSINRMAGMPYERGDFATARKMFEESLELSRKTGDRRSVGRQLGNLSETLYSLGELEQARALYQEAMAVNRESGNKTSLSDNLWGLARLQAAQGDLAGAASTYAEAQKIAAEIGDRRFYGYALHGICTNRLAQADLVGARAACEQVIALREEIGQTDTAAFSRVALAEIELEEGRLQPAEALARRAGDAFRDFGFKDYEAAARAVQAQALHASGRSREASAAIARALELSGSSQNPHVRLDVAVTDARLRAAAGRADEAIAALEAVLAEASRRGLVALELKARLALGELELLARRTESGRARLAALATDAEARGFVLIAGKAAAASEAR